MKRSITGGLLLSCLAFSSACSSNDATEGIDDPNPTITPAAPGPGSMLSKVTLELNGLEPLGEGYVYENWVIIGGTPVSAGRFNINAGQSTYEFDLSANAATSNLRIDQVENFVLTIEPEMGDDPAPSKTKLLGGAPSGLAATLTTAPTGIDMASLGGKYMLATPTSSTTNDETQGIWFPMLDMPTLTEDSGWRYEGWIVGDSGPISIGYYLDPNGPDSDGAGGSLAGTDGAAPPKPGQDFIKPPMDLVGKKAVISIEPVPDDSTAPFALKPLKVSMLAPTPQGADVTDLPDLTNEAAGVPTGTATFE